MKILKFILFFIFVFILNNKLFADYILVENVKVDETQRNSVIAKYNALRKAENYAFSQALYFVYPQAKLNAERLFSRNKIISSITKFKIIDEHISKNRYKATINYYFDIEKFVSMLSTIHVPSYSDKQYKKVLVIPMLYNTYQKPIFFANEWFNAWHKVSKIYDIKVVNEELDTVINYNKKDFNRILKQYSAEELLIAKAIHTNDKIKIIIERPGTLQEQNTTISYTTDLEQFIITLLTNDLFTNFHTNGISVINNHQEHYQIIIDNLNHWNQIKTILIKHNYIVQYVANNIIIIEVHDRNTFEFLVEQVKNIDFTINELSENQWLISRN